MSVYFHMFSLLGSPSLSFVTAIGILGSVLNRLSAQLLKEVYSHLSAAQANYLARTLT
jgi:hypothetical protein